MHFGCWQTGHSVTPGGGGHPATGHPTRCSMQPAGAGTMAGFLERSAGAAGERGAIAKKAATAPGGGMPKRRSRLGAIPAVLFLAWIPSSVLADWRNNQIPYLLYCLGPRQSLTSLHAQCTQGTSRTEGIAYIPRIPYPDISHNGCRLLPQIGSRLTPQGSTDIPGDAILGH